MGRLPRYGCVAAAVAALLAVHCSDSEKQEKGGAEPLVVDWGELPIPENCNATSDHREEDSCSLAVECGEARVLAKCYAAGNSFDCECFGASDLVSYRLSGVNLNDACPHALAACLNWPELDAGSYDCTPTNEVDESDYCVADAECTREGVIGEAEFTESHDRVSDCAATGSGWTCGCGMPTGTRFELASTTSSPQCLDARDWCIWDGVERVGSRTCTPIEGSESQSDDQESCLVRVECESDVLLSGEEAKMYEDDVVACYRAESGRYNCSCTVAGTYSTEVTADDPTSACAAAVKKCDG